MIEIVLGAALVALVAVAIHLEHYRRRITSLRVSLSAAQAEVDRLTGLLRTIKVREQPAAGEMGLRERRAFEANR